MAEGASLLGGRHDFSAFRARGSSTGSPVKTLHRVLVINLPDQQLLRVTFEGEGFLYKMVQLMVKPDSGGPGSPAGRLAEAQQAKPGTVGPVAPPGAMPQKSGILTFPADPVLDRPPLD